MKRFLRVLLVGAASIALLSACDVAGSEDDTGTTTDTAGTDTAGVDNYVPPVDEFAAVIIEDGTTWTCSDTYGAHGADIDAVQLIDNVGAGASYWLDSVDVSNINPAPSQCTKPNNYMDPTEAKGPNDGEFSENFVSLASGWLAGEFESAMLIDKTMTIMVYEVGTKVDSRGKDEDFTLYVAQDMTCSGPGAACSVKIGTGKGEASFPLTNAGI